MNYIVFIIRKTNDIDHMLPLINKCIEKHDHIRVISFIPRRHEDYLTNYMRCKHDIFIEYPVFDMQNIFFKIFNKFLSSIKYALNGKFYKYINHIHYYLRKYATKKSDNKKFISAVFNNHRSDLIVMDKTNVRGNSIYKHLVQYASSNNILMIRLAHGIDMHAPEPVLDGQSNTDLFSNFYVDNCVQDFYVSQEEFKYGESSYSLEEGRTKKVSMDFFNKFTLGSMRFSREWVKKYTEIQKYDNNAYPIISANKKTILLVTSASHWVHTDILASLINAIIDRFDVNILWKPHTRYNKIDSKISSSLKPNNIIFSYYNTPGLMDIADVTVLCGISSIGLHSVLSLSPLVVAEHTSRYKTYYSKYMAACISTSENDVLTNIENILYGDMNCYKKSNVSKLIKNVVNSGNSVNVIDSHYDLISEMIDKNI